MCVCEGGGGGRCVYERERERAIALLVTSFINVVIIIQKIFM